MEVMRNFASRLKRLSAKSLHFNMIDLTAHVAAISARQPLEVPFDLGLTAFAAPECSRLAD